MKSLIVSFHVLIISLLGFVDFSPTPIPGSASQQGKFELPDGFKVGEEKRHVNPNRDTVIYFGNKGTKVFIPKGAFTDMSGNPVSCDDVVITFKEFKNSADMAFSGLPMHYKHLGQEYNFSSSGMFEIYGHCNGQPVKIDRDKPLVVDYHLAYQNADIAFYRLREDSANWVCVQHIEKNDVNQQPEEGLASDIQVEPEFRLEDERFNEGNILDGAWDGEWEGEWVEGGWDNDWVEEDNGDREAGTLLAEGADAGHTYPDIVKGLNVASFGVYNCDQMYKLPNRVQIAAKYFDQQGNEIRDCHVLSMIDLNYNGAFSFNPSAFTCDSKGDNVLLLFTKSETLYLLDKGEFAKKNITESGEQHFTMREVTNEIKNTDDLANYLGIDI